MLIALVLLLSGCRSESLADLQDNQAEAQHSSKNYASLDKFLQVTGIRKDDLYKDLSFSKETSSAEEFEVNTDKILETIKNQQVTAFSFIVYPKNGSTVEQQNNKDVFYNMAYLKKGNHWEKYILKYIVEKGWLSSLDTQPNKPFNGSITMIYPNAAASKTYICGFSAVPVFYCWAGHTDPNDDDCGDCWHWNTTSILCDDGSTANPNPDDGTTTGGASGFETNLPIEEYEAMMVQKFASFINNFNLNSYGFSTELKTKLFHLYLSLQEDDYIINQLLSASPTNSPQKANLLNWAIDYFNENLSTMPVDELTTYTTNFLSWSNNFFIQNPTTTWQQFQNWFLNDVSNSFLQQIVLENPSTILNYEPLLSPNFKMRKVDQLKYPKFTALVKNLKTEVQNDPIMLNRLVELSGLNQQQVLASLNFGQGPSIKLVPNLTGPSGPNYGNFNPANPTYINVNLNFVLGLEQVSLSSSRRATAFLLAVTILHEFIHFGNYVTGYDTQGNEMGNLFEISSYGVIITHYNAGYYMIQLK
ncbi:hypothetical protein [Chryseobacterium sp. EO14]|uniref:hypothetical protein n=1 Tax=Chryseobacterium sp. EO14 TaxID=2950551 RepID=UPI00210B21FE|nr:hypothetical protein [Chryseobacterium sp. EO14]MCQ4142657.1 hypothetical protein [Chryseobacterium sp. EO14]